MVNTIWVHCFIFICVSREEQSQISKNAVVGASVAQTGNNHLTIEVTHVWTNRLLGDEQEPPDCEWTPGYYGFGSSLKGIFGMVPQKGAETFIGQVLFYYVELFYERLHIGLIWITGASKNYARNQMN